MTRDNLLFSIIGLLLGFIVGFIFASSMSQRSNLPGAAMSSTQNLPSDHPAIGDGNKDSSQVFAEVQASMKKAREEPKNFDAQITAARLEYQIQRYDDAINFLMKANEIKPGDYEVIANLGMVNFDAGHYDQAIKWYKAAQLKNPDDVRVLDGLAAAALGKGDAKQAEEAIAKLEKMDPANQDLPQFRDKLASLKAGGKTN
jgi:tetratricopeptide (TPR) repeat protein